MPVSHGNTWDSNPDTFVPDQHGRSGRWGQGDAHHRAELGPPPTGGGNVRVRYPSPRLNICVCALRSRYLRCRRLLRRYSVVPPFINSSGQNNYLHFCTERVHGDIVQGMMWCEWI